MLLKLEEHLAKLSWVNLLHHLSNGGVFVEGNVPLCNVVERWALNHKMFLAWILPSHNLQSLSTLGVQSAHHALISIFCGRKLLQNVMSCS